MAKGNLFLGTAHGSVGDATLYRRNGQQVSRVRVRKIGNPRTEGQAKNRAVLSTLGVAYSYMQGIVDHSFQGEESKTKNMQKFMKLNQGIAREIGGAPAFDAQSPAYNFVFKGEAVLRPNPYAISRGTLPSVQVTAPGEGHFEDGFRFESLLNLLAGAENTTYNDVCAALGVELGTQLTFCVISDDNFTGTPSEQNMPVSYGNFHYARVILAPDDGDGTKKAFNDDSGTVTFINTNSANKGTVSFDDTAAVTVDGKSYPLAAGVIVSNYNGKWLRSNCDMVVAADYTDSNTMSEVFPSYMNAEIQPDSDLYLNQSKKLTGEA